ncbi:MULTISPECIES: FUSC family protein [Buttiauxella]|uniref:FUSC family protein n=1 Tax=Buttiauxella TaxID=82976 RepID=UPI00155FB27D|nr:MULTISPECIES: FUSC family protein [Buttiauxella]MCS3602974.1 p-hydroxybenzoic acid efflux pump subunit AaeB [Buttiauxella sp. BIGb0471]
MSRPFYRISLHHLRFAFKLTFAIALSLVIGFGFDLDMPRWAVVTAIIITTAPAFIAGGEPFTGALRHRGLLRFAGTIIGCSSALIIVWVFIWSPLTMLIIGAVWTGVCCYAATVIRIENSYALGLAGITALTIVSAIYLRPEMGAILAWFRVSEVLSANYPRTKIYL